MKRIDQFSAAEPYWVGFDGDLIPNRFVLETRTFEHAVTDIPTLVLRFWAQHPNSGWNRLACEVARQHQLSLAEVAQLLAMLNQALADATLASAHWRHVFGFSRGTPMAVVLPDPPTSNETAAGNDAASHTPRMVSVRLRDYPATVAVLAGAAEPVLRLFNRGDRLDNLALPLSGTGDEADAHVLLSVTQAAQQAAGSCLLIDRSSREAANAGYDLGQQIGRWVVKQSRRS